MIKGWRRHSFSYRRTPRWEEAAGGWRDWEQCSSLGFPHQKLLGLTRGSSLSINSFVYSSSNSTRRCTKISRSYTTSGRRKRQPSREQEAGCQNQCRSTRLGHGDTGSPRINVHSSGLDNKTTTNHVAGCSPADRKQHRDGDVKVSSR